MLYYVDHQNKTTTYDDPRIQIREKLKYEHQMLCMNEVSLVFYVGVGSMLQRFFEDISFSRTNFYGTYRHKKYTLGYKSTLYIPLEFVLENKISSVSQ